MNTVTEAINALKQGKMILLSDPDDRENEGDFVFPAENVTPEIVNFMIRNGSGIVCVAMTKDHLEKLKIPLLLSQEQSTNRFGTPFALSVEAKEGVTSGVSASDRARTIQVLVNPNSHPEDLSRPGHIYPLQAQPGGVLVRSGHTEGAIDIVKLAGFQPSAVICEAMHPDGTMVKGKDLNLLAKQLNIPLLRIDDLVNYRLSTENLIEDSSEAFLPTEHYGEWKIRVIREKFSKKEHAILIKPQIKKSQPLVRIHSCCFTGDLFGSLRCDCRKQLDYSMEKISQEGGIVIYLNQEGRGIGLFNKIRAYSLQEKGLDTIDANLKLGFPADAREYRIVSSILKSMNYEHIRLLTNNPEKINPLTQFGFQVTREEIPMFVNTHNQEYLLTKKTRFNHFGEKNV